MRALAIFLSPLIGISVGCILVIFTTENQEYYLIIILYFIAYFIALMAQFLVEMFIFLVESWGKITFKFYFSIGFYTCTIIGIISFFIDAYGDFYQKLSNAVGLFLLFFAYSCINCIVYNYLYFSKLTQNKT